MISVFSIENETDICNTTDCIKAAKLIYESINASVDPCDDFYEFACGKWIERHEIPPDASRIVNAYEIDEQMQQSIKKELLSPKNTDSNSVKYASEFFKSCFDNG